MTGIERLRQMAEDFKSVKTAEHCTFIVNTWRGRYIDDAIADIADQIERERAEDAEAIAWVREHGGVAEVEKRLMPEGMEWLVKAWPRFEDGAPVRFGEEAMGFTHKPPFVVDHITIFAGGEATVCAEAGHDSGKVENFVRVLPGERVKRPTNALDADGVKIEVGDDLYSVEGSLKFHVSHVDRINGKIATDAMFSLDKWADPAMYTHRAPVLAADGKPLREGETVWGTKGGSYHLTSVHDGKVFARHVGGSFGAEVESAGGEGLYRLRADQLTHERPDSWGRLEEDARELKDDIGFHLGDYSPSDFKKLGDSIQDRVMALVRRAKALAERDA